jgi:hypothetical protein
MSAASDFLEDRILDHVLGNTVYTPATTLYVGLFTATTGLELNTPSAEVSETGTGYIRKAVTFAAASSGSADTAATITFDVATANWGTVTHVAVMDAVTGGNVLFHGPVTSSKTIETGDTFQIAAGNLTISLD